MFIDLLVSVLFCLMYLSDTTTRHFVQYTARPEGRVWPAPGKEPRENIHRAVLITVHHESTFHATVRPFPLRHGLQVATAGILLGGVAFL